MPRSSKKYVVVPSKRTGSFVVRKRTVEGFTMAQTVAPEKARVEAASPEQQRAATA